MKKLTKLVTLSLLSVALLTACAPKQPAAEHGAHDSHGGHGEAKTSIETRTAWKLSAAQPQPNQATTIAIQINDAQGAPIEKFDMNHEKLLHLIIVSKDLAYFDHIHPEYKTKGLFEISTKLPKPGEYKLIADFIPAGGQAKTETHWIQVGNEKTSAAPSKPDASLTQVVDGKEVTLSFDKLQAGTPVQLNFSFKDAKSKAPITNLQPYLGAVGHVVIISSDVEQYIHNHPLDEKASGPDAKFSTTFPKSGVYKIWGQFQHGGKVFTVPYVIQVP